MSFPGNGLVARQLLRRSDIAAPLSLPAAAVALAICLAKTFPFTLNRFFVDRRLHPEASEDPDNHTLG